MSSDIYTLRTCTASDPAFAKLNVQLNHLLNGLYGEVQQEYDGFNLPETLDYLLVIEHKLSKPPA